ncbi:MAG: PrpR N-terminal domain-containing protein [Eubacteriales bacterium]|nr:PrpR N-terminal domain-containing protein [Eubacteriales bacterium]
MENIVLFVPRAEMLYQAHNILQEKKYQIQEMKVIATDNAVAEARRAISEGASVIIARGLQAYLIKQYTDVPVVELIMTAQEMALLIKRAKQIIKKPNPVIAVIGLYNMFCDMSYFDELYDIELRTYYIRERGSLSEETRHAVLDGADLIIGGDTVVSAATENGVPSLFLSTTEDSLRQAFLMAESVQFARKAERKSAAQMETLLDYSFNGVMRLNENGIITAANPQMEDLVGRTPDELLEHNIREIVPTIGEAALHRVLQDGKDYSVTLDNVKHPVFAVMAPIRDGERIEGAILTCQKIRRVRGTAEEKKPQTPGAGGQAIRGLPAISHFKDILQESEPMQECVRYARLYALSDKPVVLRGEPGTEKRMLAESMHNISERANGPFLDVPCEGQSGAEQREMIFGDKGAVSQVQGGTLLIHNAEELTEDNQYRLYQLLQFHLHRGSDVSKLRRVDVRIMVTVRTPLSKLKESGKISPELFYLLSGLELVVPPLRRRREDLSRKLEDTLQECCERYGRFHILTAGAKKVLMNYPWYGNLFQIEHYCDRLVLTAGKRSIDEIVARNLLAELYPEETEHTPAEIVAHGVEWSGEAAEIVKLLRSFGGSREKTAETLGISKATLWRRMKRYGIDFKKI